MRVTYRIPTSDQYAFVEVEVDKDQDTVSILETYRKLSDAFKPKEGIPTKDFNAFLDRQLNGSDNHVEEYMAMSQYQKNVVQEIKKALKRLEAKNK